MNLVYYDESLLLAMASAIGKPIKVDKHTLRVERGRFVRVCVEIDLNQLVVGKICIKGTWYKVEYEGLHVLCGQCGCYGHVTRNCSMQPMSVEVVAGPSVKATTPTNPDAQRTHAKLQEPIIANDGAVIANATVEADIMEPPHGDWLTVTRKKKHMQEPPKSKERIKDQQGTSNKFELLTKENRRHGPQHTQPNMFTPGPSGTKEVPQTPFNPKKWAKKRPRRDDHLQKKGTVNQHPLKEAPILSVDPVQLNKQISKPTQELKIKGLGDGGGTIRDLGDGVKTIMNLARVYHNQFTVLDDEEEEGVKKQEQVSGGQPHATGVGNNMDKVSI